MRRALLVLLLPFCSACNSTDAATIQLVTGGETDTFTQTPVPVTLVVSAVDANGNLTTLATAPYPTDSIDLGNQDETAVGALEVAGLDANGNELIFGSSVGVEYGALSGQTLPIFVQRVGQNARLPNPLPDARPAPVLGVLSSRFLVVAGGSDSTVATSTGVYDFAQFDELGSPPSLPQAPLSMPIVGTVALILDAMGGATYYDFSQDAGEANVPAPDGHTFAEVAGGQTLYDDDDGFVYVIGGTRTTGSATATVLEIDTNDTSNSSYPTGNLHWLVLSAPRLGASAAWSFSRKALLVAGGSATGAGVEAIAPGQLVSSPLPFPADPSTGAGMTDLGDGQHILLAGGVLPSGADAGVRALDLSCTQSCGTAPETQVWSSLPMPLTLGYAFAFSPAQGFLVGSEVTSGLTHTFLLTTTAATEVPTKVSHTNATAVESPVVGGAILIIGGHEEIESFTPAP